MERLWCYMFTKNKPIFRALSDVIYTKIERSKFKFLLKKNKLINIIKFN